MVQAVLPLGPHRLDNPMVLEVFVINNSPIQCLWQVALGELHWGSLSSGTRMCSLHRKVCTLKDSPWQATEPEKRLNICQKSSNIYASRATYHGLSAVISTKAYSRRGPVVTHLTMIMALPGLDLEGTSKLICQIDQTHILSNSVALTPLSKFMMRARGL